MHNILVQGQMRQYGREKAQQISLKIGQYWFWILTISSEYNAYP